MEPKDIKQFIESMRWMDKGGLSVPSAATTNRPLAMSYLWAQIEWSELDEAAGQLDEVLETLKQFPKKFWVYPVSAILTAMDKHRVAEWQPGMIEAYGSTQTGQKVTEFLDAATTEERQRALFTAKPLLGLAKLAIAYSPDDGEWDDDIDEDELFLNTYLKLCDVVEAATQEGKEAANTTEDLVRNLLRFIVQEGEYGEAGAYGEQIVRLDRLLRGIPAEAGAATLPTEAFEAGMGISLERFMLLAAAVLAQNVSMDTTNLDSIAEHMLFDPDDLARLTHATSEEIERVFDKLSLTAEDARSFQNEDASQAIYYTDYRAFRLRPLWKVEAFGGVRYVPISAPFMKWRITDGLYWDVADALRDAAGGGTEGKKAVDRFMDDFGGYLETYIDELFEKALPTSSILGPRFYTQVRTTDHDPELDLVIPYEDAFVIGEVKAARFHYLKSVVEGDLNHIEDHDLEEKMLYGPARQLDEAIQYFQSGEVDLDGRRYDGEAVYPILITYGVIPTMWPVWPKLLQEIEDRGLLQGPNVRRLAALQVSEVEVLAALVAKGFAARDVIREYIEGEHAEVSFRNYANAVYGDDASVYPFFSQELEDLKGRFANLFHPE